MVNIPYMVPMGICVHYDTYADINKYVKKYTCVDMRRLGQAYLLRRLKSFLYTPLQIH